MTNVDFTSADGLGERIVGGGGVSWAVAGAGRAIATAAAAQTTDSSVLRTNARVSISTSI
jgi:hypothetical protein